MSAQDPPAETTARKRTRSFICELPLRVTPAQERVLLARLEAARQVYNACLGEANRRVGLVRQSKAFQRARALPKDDPARRTLFREARAASACSEYGLHAYADQLRQSWLGDHLDSNTCQKLATRAYGAANRLLVGKARRVRFKGRHQLDTVEGKTNTSGIRWRGTRVEWSDLVLPARIKKRDPVLAHGLACPNVMGGAKEDDGSGFHSLLRLSFRTLPRNLGSTRCYRKQCHGHRLPMQRKRGAVHP